MKSRYKVLIVDDEEFNLDILNDYLTDADYDVVSASNGKLALDALIKNSDIDVIVLDRMMPVMDGMEMLSKLKAHEEWKNIPVIMQTAAASSQQIMEGVQAGVYYYLAKPYDESLLLSIVRAAIRDYLIFAEVRQEVQKQRRTLGLMERGRFRFRTLEESSNLCYFIANCFPDPSKVVYGLNELMVNAVEHGNLLISYEEKSELVQAGKWREEVERRLALPEYQDKFAILDYEAKEKELVVTIRDQGPGFNWQNYVDFSPDRATDPNGRGIAIAKIRSFPVMEYRGSGNEVICTIPR
ncbi:MAG: response regulator [Rickettsiales bacterium]|nr:response regulator [Rickettsiales bacterium]